MQRTPGIYRDEAGLTAAPWRGRRAAAPDRRRCAPPSSTAYNPGWHLCRDLRNMLIVSEAVARAALLRQESRGAHSRLDFPDSPTTGASTTSSSARTPRACGPSPGRSSRPRSWQR